MTPVNAQCRLAARPVGLPKPSDWEYLEEPAPEPKPHDEDNVIARFKSEFDAEEVLEPAPE